MILFGSFGRKAGFFGKWQEPLGAQAQGRQSRHKGEEPCVLPAKQQHGGQTVAQEGKDRQKPFRAAVVQRPQGREQQEQQLRAGVPAQPAQGKKFQRRGQNTSPVTSLKVSKASLGSAAAVRAAMESRLVIV